MRLNLYNVESLFPSFPIEEMGELSEGEIVDVGWFGRDEAKAWRLGEAYRDTPEFHFSHFEATGSSRQVKVG